MIDLREIDPKILATIVKNSQAMTLLATFKWLVNYEQDFVGEEAWGVYATVLDLVERHAIVRRSTPTDAVLAAGRLAAELAGMLEPQAAGERAAQAASAQAEQLLIEGDEDVSC